VVGSTQIKAIAWDKKAGLHLCGVGSASVAYYRAEFEEQRANLFGVFVARERVGTVLMRWEVDNKTGDGIAVMVAAGSVDGKDHGAMKLFEQLAWNKGSKFMRIHTRRAGLVRKLAAKARRAEMIVSWKL
jgi:hypothetical protein